MYAEFVAWYEATGQVMWLKKFVPDLRVVDSIERPLKLYCDNEPAIFYAHNNKSSDAGKHISTKKMLVDPLTKGLPSNMFNEHVVGMGLRESL
jgi:hypothetical protein